MAGQTERTFDADSRTPSQARGFAKAALPELIGGRVPQALYDDVELIVSELITNAVRAGSPSIHLALSYERTRVVLRVSDRAVGWPHERSSAATDPGGRGLPLVSALSAAWGVRLVPGGKIVWAELAVPA